MNNSKRPFDHRDHRARFMGLFLIWRLDRKPMHGYVLINELRGLTMNACKPATIYNILAGLEKRGFVSEKVQMHGGRARKTYRTTEKGRGLFRKVKREKIRGAFREFLKALTN